MATLPPANRPETLFGYQFKDIALLSQALTHRSFGARHNERLEFLGDGVLGCAIAQILCERFPNLAEGQLTRLRANLVREESLASIAREVELASVIRLGQVEASVPGGVRTSILADTLEAVFGAIFQDGGYDNARSAILSAYASLLERVDPSESAKDPKTRLQELLQGRRMKLPQYQIGLVSGAPHEQQFRIDCRVDDLNLVASGYGTSRQRAEQHAAKAMLEKLSG